MKKFSFTMQSILNVKTTMREAAEAALAETRAELRRQEEKLERLKLLIKEAQNMDSDNSKTGAAFFVQRERYIRKLRELHKSQMRSVEYARRKVEMALAALQDAIIEEKKMEKAKEKQHAAWQLEYLKDEQKNIDEMGSQAAFYKKFANI